MISYANKADLLSTKRFKQSTLSFGTKVKTSVGGKGAATMLGGGISLHFFKLGRITWVRGKRKVASQLLRLSRPLCSDKTHVVINEI
jgi:hypothetical protein